ncbi:MAG TPA: serine/threonine-protein kinase [Mycobacteriales bacterium]|nr:serine/threonine-protein kinase [Mycobacteriales bacterium]
MTAPVQGSTSQPRIVAGRYRLGDLLGRGAMGAVWQAEDSVLRRPVAVKEVLLPHGLSPKDRAVACERTLREARSIARLAHPNVVTLFDVLDEDGRPWVVMELVPARSLAQVVREDGPLPPGQVAVIGLAVLGALEAAHAAGITHRDVKPGNILIAVDGRVKLTDFGIARSVEDSALTSTGLLLGSPSYIAPEVVRGESAGPAADLFGLGATLYATVEGRPPFRGDDPISTLNKVASSPPDPYRLAGPLIPVVEGLLRKSPADRLTAAEGRRMLREITGADGGAATVPVPGRAAGPPSSPPAGYGGQPGYAAPPGPGTPGHGGTPPWPPRPGPPSAPRHRYSPSPSPSPAQPYDVGRPAATRWKAGVAAIGVGLCVLLILGGAILLKGVFGGAGGPAGSGAGNGSHASGPALSAAYRTFTDPRGTYTVSVPQGWVAEPGQRGVVDVQDPADSGRFLRFISDRSGRDPLAVLRSEEPGFAKRYPSYTKISLGVVDFRGFDAADWEFTFVKDGVTKHVLYRTFRVDRRRYGIYLSAPDPQFAAVRQHFDAAAASFTPQPG